MLVEEPYQHLIVLTRFRQARIVGEAMRQTVPHMKVGLNAGIYELAVRVEGSA